jgi:hypothetical protein
MSKGYTSSDENSSGSEKQEWDEKIKDEGKGISSA